MIENEVKGINVEEKNLIVVVKGEAIVMNSEIGDNRDKTIDNDH